MKTRASFVNPIPHYPAPDHEYRQRRTSHARHRHAADWLPVYVAAFVALLIPPLAFTLSAAAEPTQEAPRHTCFDLHTWSGSVWRDASDFPDLHGRCDRAWMDRAAQRHVLGLDPDIPGARR